MCDCHIQLCDDCTCRMLSRSRAAGKRLQTWLDEDLLTETELSEVSEWLARLAGRWSGLRRAGLVRPTPESMARERFAAAEQLETERDRAKARVAKLAKALMTAGPCVCAACGELATCFGVYEEAEEDPEVAGLFKAVGGVQFACDACCGHGNEDGWCEPVPRATKRSEGQVSEFHVLVVEIGCVVKHPDAREHAERVAALVGRGEAARARCRARPLRYARGAERGRRGSEGDQGGGAPHDALAVRHGAAQSGRRHDREAAPSERRPRSSRWLGRGGK